jgi:Protein of unknown function (DUF3370)
LTTQYNVPLITTTIFPLLTVNYQLLTVNMFNVFTPIFITQATPEIETPIAPEPPQYIIQKHPVRSLPGKLDKIPVFNSNSPEVVKNPGVLLSTFAPQGKSNGSSHLNYTFNGRFDIFTHHIARPEVDPVIAKRQMNLGIVAHNPSNKPVKLDIIQSLSYTSKDDAPFQILPAYADNANGDVYSGPGSRLATDILRGVSDPPTSITIAPGQTQVIFNRPIPTGSARSSLMKLRSNGGVQIASIALLDNIEIPPVVPEILAPFDIPRPPPAPVLKSPQEADWLTALNSAPLATPRDEAPSLPGRYGALVYGRVAGVSLGTRWEASLTDGPGDTSLTIPDRDRAFSYLLNGVSGGTLGTGQIQTALLAVRYPDTAREAHGNYTTYYRLTMPLANKTSADQAIAIKMQTPLKDDLNSDKLRFSATPNTQIAFRGTVRIAYPQASSDEPAVRQIHVIQHKGEQGKPLVTINIPAGGQKLVEIDLVYPPDATPPQVFTIETIDPATALAAPSERLLPLVPVEIP